MEYRNLIQYIFSDGHEQIADQKRRIIIMKDPIIGYFLAKGKLALKVLGSTPSLDNLVGFSNIPKIGERLVTFKGLPIFGKYYISDVPIRTINRNVQFQPL